MGARVDHRRMEDTMSVAELTQDPVALQSPFALMHPDAAREIVMRAAALELPSRRCSPLSNPRLGGSPLDAEDGDAELG
jgi:aryl-alcohol dehydrogenase-like predicted oxidoreductase